MLVISGADLVGKSTLARACTEELQRRGYSHMLHHLSRPPASWDGYRNYVERMCVNSVWDRFHLDALPYRVHDDHPWTMSPLRWRLVCAAFVQHGGFQVVAYADEGVIRTRHAERGDAMYSLDHILRVNQSFYEMCGPACAARLVRGDVYQVQVDMYGDVTAELTATHVVDRYVRHLNEFLDIIS